MFARKRFVLASIAALAVIFQAGCQTPGGLQPIGGKSQQSPTPAKEKSTEQTPTNLPPAKIAARTYLAAAQLHEGQNRPLPALEQYRHALAEDPKNVHILVRMGYLYDTTGNSAMAEKAYLEAVRCEPNNAQIHNNLAFSYILRQRWKDAETALNRAIELAPEFARARINLGMVLAQTGRFDDALRQFQMVLPPEEAYYNLGLMYQSKRKMVEAAEAYKRAIEANPKLVAAQQQLEKMPSEVLGAADRKIQEAAEAAATLAAASPEPATQPAAAELIADSSTDEIAATQPADASADAVTEVFGPSSWFDDYINGMLAEPEEWVPTESSEPVEMLALADEALVSATQPAEAGMDSGIDLDSQALPVVFPAALTGHVGEVPTTAPADNTPEPRLLSLDVMRASELDALLAPWHRSPELILANCCESTIGEPLADLP